MRANPSARLAIREAETTIFSGVSALSLVDEVVEPEQNRAEHEKLEQRLSQQPSDQGVYQIGDV